MVVWMTLVIGAAQSGTFRTGCNGHAKTRTGGSSSIRFSLPLGTALALGVTLASPVGAQPAEPVRVMTTRTLAELCGLPAANPNQAAAQGFCRGFLIGAGQYHNEMSRVRGARPIFCLPTPSPSIETAQANFVSWAAANPQFSGETAVNSVMRWAETAFPCQPAPSRRTTSR